MTPDEKSQDPFNILGLPLQECVIRAKITITQIFFLLFGIFFQFYPGSSMVRQGCSLVPVSDTCEREGQISNHALLHYVSGQ